MLMVHSVKTCTHIKSSGSETMQKHTQFQLNCILRNTHFQSHIQPQHRSRMHTNTHSQTYTVYHLYLSLPTTCTHTHTPTCKLKLCCCLSFDSIEQWRRRDQSLWDSILNGHKTNEQSFSHGHLNESNESACHRHSSTSH